MIMNSQIVIQTISKITIVIKITMHTLREEPPMHTAITIPLLNQPSKTPISPQSNSKLYRTHGISHLTINQ